LSGGIKKKEEKSLRKEEWRAAGKKLMPLPSRKKSLAEKKKKDYYGATSDYGKEMRWEKIVKGSAPKRKVWGEWEGSGGC